MCALFSSSLLQPFAGPINLIKAIVKIRLTSDSPNLILRIRIRKLILGFPQDKDCQYLVPFKRFPERVIKSKKLSALYDHNLTFQIFS